MRPLLPAALLLSAPIFAIGAPAPVEKGLILWLEAGAQPAARQAASLPSIVNRQPVDAVLDQSARARTLIQVAADKRPMYVSDGTAAYFQFDGKDDYLSLSGERKLTPELTVFVVAAPKSNPGAFSALYSTAETGKNDYTSGLNLDFGPFKTTDLSFINVETGGHIGVQDLLVPSIDTAAERPLGDFHVFTVRSSIGKGGTQVFLDGFKASARDRLESNIGLDQMVVGARLCSNDANQPPYVQGFFDGAIAEILVYDRALNDSERQQVEQGLLARTPALQALLHGAHGHALETLPDPPIVQMLVPGFTVQELPLKIGNLNNVRYRPDGKAVGVGYDGRIYLLSDSNGDGLEDKAEFFWDQTTMRGPIGAALLGKNDPRGDGVFVGSKGKVSLFLDRDRDGKADEETIVASGWPESFHGVDTVGLTVDPKDGSVYFGLGCANFADAYLIDKKTGKSAYDIHSTHGTIQRLSADFTQRETICTGVRFTCALAFNAAGDLFASEQEGATWLPNGNPFDELLHIERNKHYGFPPRHPKHLPDVVDEPAVFEYAPQHQSTVGMVFNEGVNGGPHFGPASWKGNALVCGESRGKIYRTQLVKTPHGYVARNELIACLGLLLVDSCVAPDGSLLVACHSGPPDWGTGPTGNGRLFKIRYTGKDLPQPVVAWASAPDEFRIAFDKPLDPPDWKGATGQIKIEAGRFVSAGDRFEVVRPGYQAVRDQMAMPRRWVDVLGTAFAEDQRTLVVRVSQQSEPVNYSITLPLPARWMQSSGLKQFPTIELQVSMNGVMAEARTDTQIQHCVLPHPSLAVADAFTKGSSDHQRFLEFARKSQTKLAFTGILDRSNPYVPSTQPGAKLDWDVEHDAFANTKANLQHGAQGQLLATFDSASPGRLEAFAPLAAAGDNDNDDYYVSLNDRSRALSPQRIFVPWTAEQTTATPAPKVRTDVRGHWLAGRRLFFGEAGCFSCHLIRGEGTSFGPDLSNLVYRDRDSVLTDILNPSATINPDHAGSIVKLRDGSELTGLVQKNESGDLMIAMAGGARMEIDHSRLAGIEPAPKSLMLDDYGKRLSKEQQEDLLTFLLINPLEPATITRADPSAPAARRLADVLPILPIPDSVKRAGWKPLRILLSFGDKDHGLDEHDYPRWLERWSKLLPLADGISVATCHDFPTAEQFVAADVVIFYSANGGWDTNAIAILDDYQKRGGGLVYLHYAIGGRNEFQALADRIGFSFGLSAFRHGEMNLTFTKQEHPITKGLPTLQLLDESYWRLGGDPKRVSVLANSEEEGSPQPQVWTLEKQNGRVFGCIPGHYTWTFDDPLYRLLVLRGIAWAAKQSDVDRLSELALVGARFSN